MIELKASAKKFSFFILESFLWSGIYFVVAFLISLVFLFPKQWQLFLAVLTLCVPLLKDKFVSEKLETPVISCEGKNFDGTEVFECSFFPAKYQYCVTRVDFWQHKRAIESFNWIPKLQYQSSLALNVMPKEVNPNKSVLLLKKPMIEGNLNITFKLRINGYWRKVEIPFSSS